MSKNAISVRPATLVDADVVVEYNRAIAHETEDKTLDLATVAAGVQQALEDPGRCSYFIAEVDGVVAGQTMVTFEWSDWRNGYFWWIQSVYVDERFRRRGVFRALYDHVRNLAKSESDVCGLRLYVDRDNARALETYSNLGMTLTDYLLCEEEWPDR
jgi:GNAT superfamily N-acetyltransferase